MVQFMAWLLEEEPLPECWNDLYSEYISLRENKGSQYILSLVKEIVFLKAKYQIVEQCCTTLLICFKNVLLPSYQELKEVLRWYNFRQALPMDNEALFTRDVRAILSANKKMITTWQRKEQELKEYQEKHSGKSWDRKAFYVWAITLGEHQGYRVDLDVTTVAEWCHLLNNYEKYCEVVNAQQKSKNYAQRK